MSDEQTTPVKLKAKIVSDLLRDPMFATPEEYVEKLEELGRGRLRSDISPAKNSPDELYWYVLREYELRIENRDFPGMRKLVLGGSVKTAVVKK